MKRFLVGTLTLALLFAGLVPIAGAAPIPKNVFEGTGSATALDLTLPGLLGIAKTTGEQNLIEAATRFPGLTVGHTFSTFKVDGIKDQTTISGLAAGDCKLLSQGVDPLTACSQGTTESSSAPGTKTGDDKSTCSSLTLPIAANIDVIALNTACSRSNSTLNNGILGSVNEASVALAGVSLDLSVLGLEETKDSVVSSVQAFVVGAVNSLPQNDLTDATKADLATGLESFLTSIAQGSRFADVKVGASSVLVDTAGTLTTITSKAAGATVELLGVTVGSKTDYLITIEVSQAIASANWDQVKGVASAKATQALATLRIKDLAGLCELGLPCENNYVKIVVEADAVNSLLAPLSSIPLLHTTISVGPATQEQTGKSVVATASGVEIHALKGLGESAPGKLDGGIDLRVAVAGVTLSGVEVLSETIPPLPLTGGPTYLYIAGAILLAGAAYGLFRWSTKLRAAAAS